MSLRDWNHLDGTLVSPPTRDCYTVTSTQLATYCVYTVGRGCLAGVETLVMKELS